MTDDEATANSERTHAVEGPVERTVVRPAGERACWWPGGHFLSALDRWETRECLWCGWRGRVQ